MTASKTPAAPDVTLRQSARWLPADMDTPISLFLGMCHEHHGILLESAEVDGRWGRYSILACDFLLQAACRDGLLALDTNDDRLRPFAVLNGMPFTEGLRTLMRGLHLEKPEGITLPPITRALYGYFGYGMASFFNKKLENCLPQKDADASLVLPGTVLVFDHLYNRLCQISLGEHRDVNGARTRECGAALPFIGEDAVTATPGREGYMDAVNKIKQMLRQGEAIQVVPSCRFSTPFAGDAFTLYRRMRRCNASPYMFFMDLPGITLFGSSPEVMVRCDEGKLQLSPIAGTRKRGADDLEDARLAAELQEDPKERAEHVMLVDLGRNDLGRIARPGTVNVAHGSGTLLPRHAPDLADHGPAPAGSRRAGRAGGDLPGGYGQRRAQGPGYGNHRGNGTASARPLRGLHRLARARRRQRQPRYRHHHPQHVGKGWETPLAGGRRHRLRLRSRRRME